MIFSLILLESEQMPVVWVIILLLFAIFMLLLKIYNHPQWKLPKYKQRVYVPSWKEIKEILSFKQKKKFYEEGYADEPDEDEFEAEKKKVIAERMLREKKNGDLTKIYERKINSK